MSLGEPPVLVQPGRADAGWAALRRRLRGTGYAVGYFIASDAVRGGPAGHRLAGLTLARLLDVAPDRLALARDARRRPYAVLRDTGARLTAAGWPVDVNLSHTEDVLVVGVSLRGRIGVDVERADRPIATSAGMLARFCGPGERAVLATLPPSDRVEHTVRLWTCKEAVAKADGRGLALGLASLPVLRPSSAWTVHASRVPHLARPAGPGFWVATALLPVPVASEVPP
jgi:phosphopantetheinyl transferase